MANPNPTTNTTTDKKPLQIVALGSSFAAGPGIQPQALKTAGRSAKNYPHLLAKRLSAQLTDLTVSGATLSNVLSEPQLLSGNSFPPQLANLPSDVDIVTITGGGNDLGYIGAVIQSTLQSNFVGQLLARFWLMPAPLPEGVTVSDVAKRFVAVIDKIRESAPHCRIFLVEYLTLFGPHVRPGIDVSFDAAKITEFRDVAENLKRAYEMAAEAREGCRVVSVGELSWDHGLGSDEPWVEGFAYGMLFTKKAPFHPNENGMEAVANLLYEVMNDGQ